MLKPITKARSPKLFEKKEGYALTAVSIDVLFHHARVLSEGLAELENESMYSGSTMITFELCHLNRGGMGARAFALRIRDHMRHSILFRTRLMRLARHEAQRHCGERTLGEIRVASEFEIDGEAILVDMDVSGAVQTVLSAEEGRHQ